MKKNSKGWREFLIGSWITYFDYSVMSQEDQMKRLAELGINYQPFPFVWYGPETHDDLTDWKEIDRLCVKYGVYYGMESAADKLGTSERALRDNLAFAREMSDNLIVYHVMDEPSAEQIPELAAWVRRYAEADARVASTFNLLPSYCSEKMLGGTYESYLQRAVDAVGAENMCFLSHDYYPFKENGTKFGIFTDMETNRKVAYRNGKLRTHAFLQANAWKGMRMPNADELRWSAYCYLAYGFKALSYFNVVSPNRENAEGYVDGMIMNDGSVPDPARLDALRALNREIRATGNVLLGTETVHAYHTHAVTEGIELLPEDFRVRPVEAERRFILTEHDAPGLFMIVNNDFEWSGSAAFRVAGITRISQFDPMTGAWRPCRVENGTFEARFRKGDGLLFRVEE